MFEILKIRILDLFRVSDVVATRLTSYFVLPTSPKGLRGTRRISDFICAKVIEL
jgi:hypothetical protein